MLDIVTPLVRAVRMHTPLALSQRLVSDERYLKMLYKHKLGKTLNLDSPRDFNEKLQWLKLHDRRPEYVSFVDKYSVKDYVAAKVGSEYVIPTIGCWDRPEDVDWDSLPEKFVLKTTHGGGSRAVIICTDKATFDRKAAVKNLRSAGKRDIYKCFAEWPYKDVPRRVIAEEFIGDTTVSLNDYKFYCFNGKPVWLLVVSDRFGGHYLDYMDIDFNPINLSSRGGARNPNGVRPPENYDQMLKIAATLSEGIPHVRVDLYNVDGKVLFGELTLFDSSGFNRWSPQETLDRFGDCIELPER